MSNIIDISSRITNELPMVKITDDIIVTVNNRKNTVLNIQAMAKEVEKKSEADGSKEYDQMAFMNKAMEMLVGAKNTKAIDSLNLPFPEYQDVYETIMSVATGQYDTPSK